MAICKQENKVLRHHKGQKSEKVPCFVTGLFATLEVMFCIFFQSDYVFLLGRKVSRNGDFIK